MPFLAAAVLDDIRDVAATWSANLAVKCLMRIKTIANLVFVPVTWLF